MDHKLAVAPQARLLVGMGGSGIKTLSKFVDLLTEHSEETANSEVFMAYLLVDTDNGELAEYAKQIRSSYRRVHREPIVKIINLSADITDFSAFVATTLENAGHHERLQDAWWYRRNREGKAEPFTAINLKDSPTAGAGQCPQVSTFLAWNRMREIDDTIDELLDDLKNRSTQGKNLQNWTLDVSLISSLAGGTGRGCWHLVASKIREKLRDLNQRPKPVGFFFDSSIFGEDVKREEQVMKLQVNSVTGVSELIAWLRNEYERETDLPPYQFRLPCLDNPESLTSDLIDTTKLNLTVDGAELTGITGRSPVSAAYLIFGAGKQGTLGNADAYYHSVASALYARLYRSTISKTINEAGHLNGLGCATISVPINGIRTYVQSYVKQFLPTHFSQPLADDATGLIAKAFLQGLETPEQMPVMPKYDATNVHQRVFDLIVKEAGDSRDKLTKALDSRDFNATNSYAGALTNWATGNPQQVKKWVDTKVREALWGTYINETSSSGGTLQQLVDKAWKNRVEKSDPKRDKDGTLLSVIFNKRKSQTTTAGTKTPDVNPVVEALRFLMNASEVTLPGPSGNEKLDISSYGTKHAVVQKIVDAMKASLLTLHRYKETLKAAPKINSPAAELASARQGLWKSGIDQAEKKRIKESVNPWLIRESAGLVTDQLIEVLNTAVKEGTSLAECYAAITELLSNKAKKQESDIARERELHFWSDSDFAKILEPDTSTFTKDVLSAQTLQAVEKDGDLKKQFLEIINKSSLKGFEEAKDRFVESLQQWISKQHQAESLEKRKLSDILDVHVGTMADQLMIPPTFYEEHFGFFATVKALMNSWGMFMQKRAGSPQDIERLKQVFENQFGVPFPMSGDKAPKELDEAAEEKLARDACRAMAVRLGGRTDPLFQQRFDEGERPTYDNVGVVLPTEKIFDKAFAKDIEADAKLNPQFSASGQFSATATHNALDGGNPYTMFAYATQQFEDWRREAGMARIASLEYYKTPAVLAWLRACEDVTGASVFLDGEVLKKKYGIQSCRDIYGLGYISPRFLHDKTLSEFRWSPWSFKRRAADRSNELLDLLAYALLDVPRNVPTKHFQHFVKVLDKAHWQMPLLTWQAPSSEDSPSLWIYKRPAVQHCTEVLRTKERDATHPAFPANHTHVSIRKCLEELHENESVAAAISGEAAIFMNEVLCNKEFVDDFDAATDIHLAFRYLGDRLKQARNQEVGPAAERMRKVIDDLLKRVDVLETYSPEKLKEHFDAIRRNSELQTRA